MKTLTALIAVLVMITVVAVELIRSGHWLAGLIFAAVIFGMIQFQAKD